MAADDDRSDDTEPLLNVAVIFFRLKKVVPEKESALRQTHFLRQVICKCEVLPAYFDVWYICFLIRYKFLMK